VFYCLIKFIIIAIVVVVVVVVVVVEQSGRWYNIIVLNAHAPTEERNDTSKNGFLWN
jgi:hypothetical protein